MTELISEENIDKPPFFKKWRYLYLAVLGWLVMLIILFYLFTVSYS